MASVVEPSVIAFVEILAVGILLVVEPVVIELVVDTAVEMLLVVVEIGSVEN